MFDVFRHWCSVLFHGAVFGGCWDTQTKQLFVRPGIVQPRGSWNCKRYTYRPLESDVHIRVLELLPDVPGSRSPLRCKLHHVDLTNPTTTYTAISYTWGDASVYLRQPVYIDGEGVCMVSPNLHACLRRLRTERGSMYIWADAICINQTEERDALQERAVQVQLMRRIFSEAREVVADISSVSGDEDLLVDGFHRISAIDKRLWISVLDMARKDYAHHSDSEFMLVKSFSDKKSYYNAFESLVAPLELPVPTHPFWTAFQRLSDSPYLQRIWIMPELAVAGELYFMLGRRIITKKLFRRATKRACDYYNIIRWYSDIYRSRLVYLAVTAVRICSIMLESFGHTIFGHQSMVKEFRASWIRENSLRIDLFAIRRWAQLRSKEHPSWIRVVCDLPLSRNPLALSNLFDTFRHFDCSDPRDRLYAILGLADDGYAPELYVDYQESTEAVSFRFSQYLVRQGEGSSLLYNAEHNPENNNPSWALSLQYPFPDNHHLVRLATSGVDGEKDMFRAAGSSVFSCSLHGRQLVTRGTLLGSITTRTESFRTNEHVSLPVSVNTLYAWAGDVSAWIPEQARYTYNLSPNEYRLGCIRALFCDLRDNGDGTRSRLGNSDEAMSLLHSLESTFPLVTTRREYARFLFTQIPQRARDTQRWRRSTQLLFHLISKRCLGVAIHYGEDYHRFPGCRNPPTVGSPAKVEGWICQLPDAARVDDEVAIINGCRVPFVLRRNQEDGTFRIVGVCYVSGMMDGDEEELRRSPQRRIVLA